MKLYKYGNPESDIVLIEPVGDHNLNEIPNQVERIKTNTKKEIQMLAIKVESRIITMESTSSIWKRSIW